MLFSQVSESGVRVRSQSKEFDSESVTISRVADFDFQSKSWSLTLPPQTCFVIVCVGSIINVQKTIFFHGSTCKVDKRGSFGVQNTSLPLKNRKKGFLRLHRAHFFYKQKSSKYKGKSASGLYWLSFLT